MFNFLVALLLCTAASDSIFCDHFGDYMYISVDRPDTIVWTLDSTPTGDAAFLNSSTYLNDGKVAIPTRISWDTGTVVITAGIIVIANVAVTASVGQTMVFAVFCPNTPFAVPAGVEANFAAVSTLSHGINFSPGGSVFVALNNGGTAFIGTHTFTQAEITALNAGGAGSSTTLAKIEIGIKNDLDGSTWIAAGDPVDLGEFWFGTLVEFKALTDPKYDLVDPTLMRRSHSNQPWPLFVKPYRQWTYNFAPMDTTTGFDSTLTPSFDQVRYQISQANCALFLTRIYEQGTSTFDPVAAYQQMCFGKPDSVGALSAVKEGMGLWAATAKIGEAPP